MKEKKLMNKEKPDIEGRSELGNDEKL